jgi:hypothetical protein
MSISSFFCIFFFGVDVVHLLFKDVIFFFAPKSDYARVKTWTIFFQGVGQARALELKQDFFQKW